jgi:hypothetical protein
MDALASHKQRCRFVLYVCDTGHNSAEGPLRTPTGGRTRPRAKAVRDKLGSWSFGWRHPRCPRLDWCLLRVCFCSHCLTSSTHTRTSTPLEYATVQCVRRKLAVLVGGYVCPHARFCIKRTAPLQRKGVTTKIYDFVRQAGRQQG